MVRSYMMKGRNFEMINRLCEKIKKLNAPVVVGLDPMLSYVPEHVVKKSLAEYGETLSGAADAIWQFNKEIVDAVYDLIPAVKPQVAMYEQFGIEGMKAYQRTVDYCHEKGLIVIGDVKRGDIGSTSAAYAAGHLGKVQVGSRLLPAFDEDFVTVNPYLGTDGVKPYIDVKAEHTNKRKELQIIPLPLRDIFKRFSGKLRADRNFLEEIHQLKPLHFHDFIVNFIQLIMLLCKVLL